MESDEKSTTNGSMLRSSKPCTMISVVQLVHVSELLNLQSPAASKRASKSPEVVIEQTALELCMRKRTKLRERESGVRLQLAQRQGGSDNGGRGSESEEEKSGCRFRRAGACVCCLLA